MSRSAERDRGLVRRFRELFVRDRADPAEPLLAAELGRALAANAVPVEEIAELYHETLQEMARVRPDARFAELGVGVSMLLRELLIAYGPELRSNQEQRDAARQPLEAYAERLEERVEELTRALRHGEQERLRAERLAVVGQLAGAVGHELRTPLGAVKNVGYLLRMALDEPSREVSAALEILEREVDDAVENVERLLRFAEPRTPQLRRVDLCAVARAALAQIVVPPEVELEQDLAPETPAVLGDPEQLGQALRGLLLNALDALGARGLLRVSTLRDVAGDALLVVRDTGCGIPADRMGRLFEPSYTTKAKGLGLGLPLAKLLVEANGGRIEAVSDVGVGSAFSIRLPPCCRATPPPKD